MFGFLQRKKSGVFGLGLLLLGCGGARGPIRTIDWPRARVTARSTPSAGRVGAPSPPNEPTASRAKAVLAEPRPTDLGSSECLAELEKWAVPFRPLGELRGVETPVEIRGPIGPVMFWVNGGGPIRMDCRLALTLRKLGPLFEAHQLTRARFSGAYVFRTTRGGRLSHHAHGLALDVHEVVLAGQQFSVSHDFLRRAECTPDAPAINRLACALRESHAFEELLTPDYDADHHDHLHIAVRRGPATALALTLARAQADARAIAERKAAIAERKAAPAVMPAASPQAPAAPVPAAAAAASPEAPPEAPPAASAAASLPALDDSAATHPPSSEETPPPPPPLPALPERTEARAAEAE